MGHGGENFCWGPALVMKAVMMALSGSVTFKWGELTTIWANVSKSIERKREDGYRNVKQANIDKTIRRR